MDQNITFRPHAYRRLHERTSLKMSEMLKMIRLGIYILHKPDPNKANVYHYAFYSKKDDNIFSIVVDDHKNEAISTLESDMIALSVRYQLEDFLRFKYNFIHHELFSVLNDVANISFKHKAKDILIYSLINKIIEDTKPPLFDKKIQKFKNFLSENDKVDQYILLAIEIQEGFIPKKLLIKFDDEKIDTLKSKDKIAARIFKTTNQREDYKNLLCYFIIYRMKEYKSKGCTSLDNFLKLKKFISKNDITIADYLNQHKDKKEIMNYYGFLLSDESIKRNKAIKKEERSPEKKNKDETYQVSFEDKYYRDINGEASLKMNCIIQKSRASQELMHHDIFPIIKSISKQFNVSTDEIKRVKITSTNINISFKINSDNEWERLVIFKPAHFEFYSGDEIIKSGIIDIDFDYSLFHKSKDSVNPELRHLFVDNLIFQHNLKGIDRVILAYKDMSLHFSFFEDDGKFDLVKKEKIPLN